MIKEKCSELEKEVQLLREEMVRGGQVQRASLPSSGPVVSGYDIGVAGIQSREIGGDIFDFFLPKTYQKNPMTGRFGIMMADVVDKGVHAAYLAAMVHALFHAESFRVKQPDKTMLQINYYLELLAKGDMGRFVTAIYGVFHPITGIFDFARAGHVLPVAYDKLKKRIPIPQEDSQPLNLLLDPKIQSGKVRIGVGGMLFLLTDGVLEAPSPNEIPFGKRNFDRVVFENWDRSMPELCDRILDEVCIYEGGPSHLSDDCSIIGIRRTLI